MATPDPDQPREQPSEDPSHGRSVAAGPPPGELPRHGGAEGHPGAGPSPRATQDPTGVLAGRTIVLGVSGSIAVIKVPLIVGLLAARSARVQVATTAAARQFLTERTFVGLTRDPVLTEADLERGLDRLVPNPDALLVAPASARTLAELASGGPGLLAEIDRRRTGPLVIAPAMESKMYAHPATQRHVHVLEERGARFIGPAAGRLASGATGWGRLVEPTDLVEAFATLLAG